MATLDHRLTTVLTATPQTLIFDVNEPYSLYALETSSNITILGTTNITSSGSLIEGVTYKFKYTGIIEGGDLTIMGVAMPDQLKQKTCYIIAYYNGTNWEVNFSPNFNQTNIITLGNLTESDFGQYVIGGIVPTSGVTANIAGPQTLRSLTIPANIPGLKGYRITANGRFINTSSKELLVEVVDSGANHVVMNTGAIIYNSEFSIHIDVNFTIPGNYVTHSTLICGDGNIEKYYDEGINWDTTSNQTLTFKAEETTPTGGLVILDTLTVEKINL